MNTNKVTIRVNLDKIIWQKTRAAAILWDKKVSEVVEGALVKFLENTNGK
jgi:hypothetical protein